jgi:hypothetical protein
MPVRGRCGGVLGARRSGRVRRGSTARGGARSPRRWVRGLCSGRGGAADVELGGGGAGVDVRRGVPERLTALDPSWAVPVPADGDRAVATRCRAAWWAAVLAWVGRLAVAVPARTVATTVRQATAKDRCRAWTGCPARGPLANGAATAVAERRVARTSPVAIVQAACSESTRSGVAERRIAPVPGPAALMVDLASRRAVSAPSHRHR